LTNFRYQWEVHFNNEVPIDLRVELGAGNASIDASELDLTALEVAAGAGNVTVDLSGERRRDLAASIRGGVGNLTVLLPSQAGVQVDVSGGLGQVVATGLSRNEEGSFVNAAFDSAENTIILDIEGGVGEINLEVVE
jgi:predicted membrane protein